jgi:hypothetical protein
LGGKGIQKDGQGQAARNKAGDLFDWLIPIGDDGSAEEEGSVDKIVGVCPGVGQKVWNRSQRRGNQPQ